MRRITLILGIVLLTLALSAPAFGKRRQRLYGNNVENQGVVVETTRNSITLVGGTKLLLSHRTRFVNERGEEIPRERVIGSSEQRRLARRSRTRSSGGAGLVVIEYEGKRDGKRIRATRVTPLFQQVVQ